MPAYKDDKKSGMSNFTMRTSLERIPKRKNVASGLNVRQRIGKTNLKDELKVMWI